MTSAKRRCAECNKPLPRGLHKSRKLCCQDCRLLRRRRQMTAHMTRKRLDPVYKLLEQAQQREYKRRRRAEA